MCNRETISSPGRYVVASSAMPNPLYVSSCVLPRELVSDKINLATIDEYVNGSGRNVGGEGALENCQRTAGTFERVPFTQVFMPEGIG